MVSETETEIKALCLSAIETHFEANKHILECMEIGAEKKQVPLVRECKEFLYYIIYSALKQEFSKKYSLLNIDIMLDELFESRLGPLIQKSKSFN